MECPLCGEDLVHWDSYGRIASHQDGKVLGEILMCPTGRNEGMGEEMNDDESCDSSMHHVPGSFYTDTQGNLHEGYPC